MKKWWLLAVICSFFAGSIVSGTSILANPEDKGNPFENIQNQIDDIINGNTPIEAESKVLSLGSGATGVGNPIYACLGSGSTDRPLASCTENIPLDGKLTDLTASSFHNMEIVSPGIGGSITATLVKNGIETELSCTISGNETFCQNTSILIQVFAGDLINLKLTKNGNPNNIVIAGSVLLKP